MHKKSYTITNWALPLYFGVFINNKTAAKSPLKFFNHCGELELRSLDIVFIDKFT